MLKHKFIADKEDLIVAEIIPFIEKWVLCDYVFQREFLILAKKLETKFKIKFSSKYLNCLIYSICKNKKIEYLYNLNISYKGIKLRARSFNKKQP